ncbi:DUF1684 domain-containing protein [Terriglobus aquaticus]|uniref:DUF1684 domain-containing protein n=1 Tax=Terriglobus aquaticus TaxID=940139 RepID=A0ABW9KHX4_9BACT|nr:DUF1684 domain-containing protein [Terriglobus aquaticus]
MLTKFACSIAVLASLLPIARAEDTVAQIQSFRKDMEQEAKDPHGYLALVALQWLPDGETTVGSDASNKLRLAGLPAHAVILRQRGGQASLAAPGGHFDACVKVNGQPAREQALAPDSSGKPDEVTCGDIGMTVILRGDRLYLRVRDAHSPTLRAFHGLRWYPIQNAYQITAKWVPYPQEHALAFKNVLGQSFNQKTPGYAEFQVDGKTVRLEPVSVSPKQMWFIFRDETSRTETYGAGRFMYSAAPSNGVAKPGTVLLDFNTAYNPPCAYTPFATCPLPAPQNRLSVAIPAGEKRYHE